MAKSWIAAGLLFGLALCLVFGLLRTGTNRIVVYADGTTRSAIKSEPLVTTNEALADVICFSREPCRVKSVDTIGGVFPRAGISRTAAIAGGMVAPFLVLCASVFLALRTLRPPVQRRAAIALVVTGWFILAALTAGLIIALTLHGLDAFGMICTPATLVSTAAGFVTFAAGFWLSRRRVPA